MILKWGDIMYTLSWHQGGEKNVHQAHNRREPHAAGKDSSIDSRLTPNNIILIDIPIREAYHKLFDKSVSEYNSRTRASRQIGDYYTYIGKSNKQQAYEAIIQLGSKAEGSPEKAIEAYKRYIADWKRRNPNMLLIGAYIHCDEDGAVHLHIDYIPVAECNRGMRMQNSLTRALANQGFKTQNQDGRQVTAQIQWEQSERDCMREICRELGIDLYKQGIGRKRHLTVKEYKDCQDMIREAKAELTNIEHDKIIADFDKMELDQQIRITESKKQKLYDEINGLQQQARKDNQQIQELQKQISRQKKEKQGLKHQIEITENKKQKLYNEIYGLQQQTRKGKQQVQELQQQVKNLQVQSQKYANDNAGLQKEIEQQSAVIARNNRKIAKQQQDIQCYDNMKQALGELQDWLSYDTYIHSVIDKMPVFYQGIMPEFLKNRHEKYYNDNIKPIADYTNCLADEIQTNEQYIDDDEIEL